MDLHVRKVQSRVRSIFKTFFNIRTGLRLYSVNAHKDNPLPVLAFGITSLFIERIIRKVKFFTGGLPFPFLPDRVLKHKVRRKEFNEFTPYSQTIIDYNTKQ